jgi:AraC-like DNA-binding protein
VERPSHAILQTVPAHHLRVVLDTATEKGAPATEICSAVGLDARLLDDMEARVPLEVASDLYDECARRAADDAFGLHVAERSDYFAFDALGLAISTKENIREAFEHLGPAITALHGTRMELDIVGQQAHLAIQLPEENVRPCRHRTEAYMARVVRMIELATGTRPQLRRVTFRCERPSSVSEHERVFAAPLLFGAPRNEIAMDRSILDAPLVRADPHLSQVLDQHVRDLAARMPAVQAVADRVRRYVRDAFPRGDAGIESIGKRMGMGARTLQRWLRDEGTSHRQIVEQVRHELALRYLVETRMPIKEVAVFLGYSELRAFYRAFERWTGLAPAAYRKKAL